MTFVAPESAPVNASRIPSIVILGADALLAALPATPVQLAHACVLAGYQSVIPASWGDELIAAASLRALSDHGSLPAIQCSCPHVAHRLLAVGTDLRPFLLSLVAPPVILARYLRAAHTPGKLRITYVGRCPAAADESIDARLTPQELLAMLSDRQIVLEEQPLVYDSVLPPDRRRYRSQPGGVPAPEMLWNAGADQGARSLVELHGTDLPVELAQHLLAGKPVLIDCAPQLGCVCSGAIPGVDPADARGHVVALEPPRATKPVIDEQLLMDASLPLPASPRSAVDIVAPAVGRSNHGDDGIGDERLRGIRREESGAHQGFGATEPTHAPLAPAPARRPSPPRGITRPAAGQLPTARDAGGRQLPRTYVAHRRVPSRSVRSDAPVPPPAMAPADTAPAPQEEPAPNERGTAADAAAPRTEATRAELTASSRSTLPVGAAPPLGTEERRGSDGPIVSPKPFSTATSSAEAANEVSRYAERPIALPVTPRSDAPPRQEPAPLPSGERPVMQLLTLGLLISMIVLVSAAVGVLVGRWMTQR